MEEKYLFIEIEQEVKKTCKVIVTQFLKDKFYNSSDSEFLSEKLLEMISSSLLDISSNFKYVINVALFENKNQGYTQNTQMYYNTSTDGVLTEEYLFPNITCILTLFILAL